MSKLTDRPMPLIRVVRIDKNIRSVSGDARRRVDRHIVSYQWDDSGEYRKSFEVPPGTAFTPPAQLYRCLLTNKVFQPGQRP